MNNVKNNKTNSKKSNQIDNKNNDRIYDNYKKQILKKT